MNNSCQMTMQKITKEKPFLSRGVCFINMIFHYLKFEKQIQEIKMHYLIIIYRFIIMMGGTYQSIKRQNNNNKKSHKFIKFPKLTQNSSQI